MVNPRPVCTPRARTACSGFPESFSLLPVDVSDPLFAGLLSLLAVVTALSDHAAHADYYYYDYYYY